MTTSLTTVGGSANADAVAGSANSRGRGAAPVTTANPITDGVRAIVEGLQDEIRDLRQQRDILRAQLAAFQPTAVQLDGKWKADDLPCEWLVVVDYRRAHRFTKWDGPDGAATFLREMKGSVYRVHHTTKEPKRLPHG